jgi:hypothetical protein
MEYAGHETPKRSSFMGRRRSRSELSGRHAIQFLQMIQNLVAELDSAGVQRLMDSREVLSALADGRLTPKKAMASLGLTVVLDGKASKMDFFGVRKDSDDDELQAAFRRQGLRPATEAEYRTFEAYHPEVIHDIVVRSRLTVVLMGERVRIASRRPQEIYWGYPVVYRSRDGRLIHDAECTDSRWDKSYRFLGVRLDRRPRDTAVPNISLRQSSPKVRPTA